MNLAAAILIGWVAVSFAVTACACVSMWRSTRGDNRSRITKETPVDVLFVANDHSGSRKWA